MKAILVFLALALTAHAGPCCGGAKPSPACKTCKHCAYCGTDKGRGVNSATCLVCEKARAEAAAKKVPAK